MLCSKGRRQNTQQRITKDDKSLLVSLQNLAFFEYGRVCRGLTKIAYSLQKDIKVYRNNSWMSSPGVTFNLTCGKGDNELQNLTNLRLSSFAKSHQMQQKNFDVSPKDTVTGCFISGRYGEHHDIGVEGRDDGARRRGRQPQPVGPEGSRVKVGHFTGKYGYRVHMETAGMPFSLLL